MECPICQTKGAYIGLNEVECPNKDCKCYSPKQAESLQNKEIKEDMRFKSSFGWYGTWG